MVATGGVRKYEDTANTIVTMATMMTVYMHEDNGEIDDVARRQRQRQCRCPSLESAKNCNNMQFLTALAQTCPQAECMLAPID